MARVIGKDKAKVHRVTCDDCASIIEYTLSETKTHVHHDYGGGSDTYRTLKCPSCKETIDLGMA